MEVDVTIERISNGYIVTNNDSSHQKTFYGTLGEIMNARVIEDMNDIDRSLREHSPSDETFSFRVITDLSRT